MSDSASEAGGQAAAGGLRLLDPSRERSLGTRPVRGPWFRLFRALVWRRLPQPLRQVLMRLLTVSRPRPLARNAAAAEPICVAGLFSTRTGIGEGARLCARALDALGFEILVADLSHILANEPPGGDPPPLERGPGTVILHFNPDNLPAVLTLLGRARLRGKRIIGYWAWELPRIPDHWVPALAEVDEIWTPSRFVADAVRAATPRRVRVVPHPVAQGRTGSPRRAHFAIGSEFVALSIFSFASSYPRKNPLGAVEAFRRAFGDSTDHLLILKAADGAEAPDELAELRAAIAAAPNIRLEERDLEATERLDLIASADVLLSLHRSEGFGLVMAEAMLAGVPVIATGWSGNLDFMDETSALLLPYRMVPASDNRGVYDLGESWADPDLDVAAAHLAALAADPGRGEKMRAAARAMASDRLGLAAFAEATSGLRRRRYGKSRPRRQTVLAPQPAAIS